MLYTLTLSHGFAVRCIVEEDPRIGSIEAVLLRNGREDTHLSRTYTPGRAERSAPAGTVNLGNGFALRAEVSVDGNYGEAEMTLLHNGAPALWVNRTFSPTHGAPK